MRLFTILICFLQIPFLSYGQKDQIVATVGDLEISGGELLYAFNKNRDSQSEIHPDSLASYLDQYIKFKLKVAEAYQQRIHQSESFQKELSSYLSQLKKPYLERKNTTSELIDEAYERMLSELNVSHLLIRLDPDASPKDSLAAYHKIDSLKILAIDRQSFEKLAKANSQDGSAKDGGALGWFTVFGMVYPFETAAYQTAVGQVSEITRTRFGYHLLWVNDKRPARGKVRISHIFLSSQLHGEQGAKQKAQQAYDSLKAGSDWNRIVRKYSDDGNTKMKGGALPLAGLNQLPEDFLEIAYKLEEDEISAPQRTAFGWHVVRLDEHVPIPEKDQIINLLERQIKQSGRNQLSEPELINKLKANNHYKEIEGQPKQAINLLANKNLKEIKKKDLNAETLFYANDQPISAKDWVDYLMAIDDIWSQTQLTKGYKDFEKKILMEIEDSYATERYPEYGFLQKEYKEGLLLFEIMQAEVWDKAIQDTLGQQAYYDSHLSDYALDEHVVVTEIYNLPDSLISNLLQLNIKKSIKSYLQSSLDKEVFQRLNFAKRSIPTSEIPNFESVSLQPLSIVTANKANTLWQIESIKESGHFAFSEIRGRIISDYQDQFEVKWLKELRNKFKVKIYEKRLAALLKVED